MEVNAGVLALFGKLPGTLPIYLAFEEKMKERFPGVKVSVKKTQVSFANKYGFAYASLPVRRVKGWPEVCILVSFGLGYRLEDERIAVAVEPYPRRWTHHVVVASESQLDEQLMGWIAEAYEFSLFK